MTGEELVLILGAYTALVLGAFGMLIKFALDSRKTGADTNRAVTETNHQPATTGQPSDAPTVRELVQELHGDMRELRREGNTRHRQNFDRLVALDRRVGHVESDLKKHMADVDGREEGR